MTILITGGAGYIGSITNAVLRQKGYDTIIYDNLSTGHKEATVGSTCIYGDLRDKASISSVFDSYRIDAVMHFAAKALAGESMSAPYEYYENNIVGGLNLLEAMRTSGCKHFIFSSTCAVYGYPKHLPVTEEESYKPVSVYGASKRNFEEILEWYEAIYGIRHAFLRYFNAAGAMPDGSLGECHSDETHIIPIALEVALGKRKEFTIYGNDYHTPDGTCIRDYIHVVDLAEAHIKALEYLSAKHTSCIVNLGVGRGYSNMEVLSAVEKITGVPITTRIVERRAGDPDCIYADNTRASQLFSWKPHYTTIESIVETAWSWHKNHPKGFSV